MPDRWHDNLTALLAGPYSGRGGNQALGHDLGVTRAMIWRWRTSHNSPTHEHRVRLARLAARKIGKGDER